jgi:6-phosphogluconolactonase (cycloisomerase 2 family)
VESVKDTTLGGWQSTFSRRTLLKGAAALAAAGSVPIAFGQAPTGAPFGTVWLYISTYTGNPGGGGNGQGIYLCQLDLSTGQLTVLKLVSAAPPTGTDPRSPSTIALDPTRTHLYAGNEFGPPGAVSAYSINRATGDLALLNVQPAAGAPAHVSVDHSGKYLFSAEYSGSWFETFPIMANGSLAPVVFQQHDLGNVDHSFTQKPATNAPPGSFAFSAHEDDGHPHQMEADPSNQWVLGTDAGQDRIYVWKLTVGAATPLTPAAIPFVNTPPGDGPRHFAFHPNAMWVYSIQEEASTIMFWRFNPATGALSQQQIVASVPPGFAGTDFTSEIRVSADGNFVYGANRLSDTIGVFSVGRNGSLTQVSHASTLGDYPRIFAVDPSGRFVVVGNQRADNVTTFRINQGTGQGEGDQGEDSGNAGPSLGSLSFTGNYTPVGSPSGMVFLI